MWLKSNQFNNTSWFIYFNVRILEKIINLFFAYQDDLMVGSAFRATFELPWQPQVPATKVCWRPKRLLGSRPPRSIRKWFLHPHRHPHFRGHHLCQHRKLALLWCGFELLNTMKVFIKVKKLWEGHKIWKKILLVLKFTQYHTIKTSGRFFFKFLRPFQKIWTLLITNESYLVSNLARIINYNQI